MLVHLPIGMIFVLAALEVSAWFPRFKKANASAGFILALAAPLAVVTAICGWLLSLGGGYEKDLLFWHQWLGIATALGCVITAIYFRLGKRFAYHASLFLTAGILGATGHLGGSLTHGSDYLTHYAPSFVKKMLGETEAKPAETLLQITNDGTPFANEALPVLNKYCVACHGPQKAKGGLRVDSLAALQKGGEHGAAVKLGDVEHSLFLQRILVSDDDHMPPNGRPQPTSEEIAVLKKWVAAGAITSQP